ncbi:hypothetical protein [Amycolatopsis sp. NPDC051102]|uniref:hypothetical protein n=1 Tax=Amycolatopsis sp. NPDC051102 TaxID=3155163 RepID=UPI00344A0A04
MLPRFFDSAGRDLGGFSWGSWMDVRMRSWTAGDVPVGTAAKPFYDDEQGWWLKIRPDGGFVFVLEGEEDRDPVEIRFRVRREEYFDAWLDAIGEARKTCSTYMSLEEAERASGPVTRLVLGSHHTDSSLDDVGRVPSLRSLNLIANDFPVAPAGLRRLPALRSVRLDGNRLPESEFDRLHTWFDHIDGFDRYFG